MLFHLTENKSGKRRIESDFTLEEFDPLELFLWHAHLVFRENNCNFAMPQDDT